jgi:hypothetical protein
MDDVLPEELLEIVLEAQTSMTHQPPAIGCDICAMKLGVTL